MPSDTPTIDFTGTNSPGAWQSLLAGTVKTFGDIAIANLTKNDNKQAQVQQAPVSADSVKSWLPWIIGGVVAIAALVFLTRK